jgi:hypothetical protein
MTIKQKLRKRQLTIKREGELMLKNNIIKVLRDGGLLECFNYQLSLHTLSSKLKAFYTDDSFLQRLYRYAEFIFFLKSCGVQFNCRIFMPHIAMQWEEQGKCYDNLIRWAEGSTADMHSVLEEQSKEYHSHFLSEDFLDCCVDAVISERGSEDVIAIKVIERLIIAREAYFAN